jgi:uncharacterized membrane protein YeaQ/YmgE (transglycosylase-associated protein family)
MRGALLHAPAGLYNHDEVGVVLASVILNPGGWLAWLVVGLVAGAIAGRLVRGRGYGCLVDIVVGVIGSFIGGIVLGLVLPNAAFGFIGSLVVATLGAVLLLAAIRLISPKRA